MSRGRSPLSRLVSQRPTDFLAVQHSVVDIEATALLVIKQHGETAAFYAARRADELLLEGAPRAAVTWRFILGEIKRFEAMNPKGRVN